MRVAFGVRNDGWDTWQATGPNAVRLHAGFDGRQGGVLVPLESDVPPGGSVVVYAEIKAPPRPANLTFHVEMVRGDDGWFGDAHDMPWEKRVVIK